jgi:hypothetical protein
MDSPIGAARRLVRAPENAPRGKTIQGYSSAGQASCAVPASSQSILASLVRRDPELATYRRRRTQPGEGATGAETGGIKNTADAATALQNADLASLLDLGDGCVSGYIFHGRNLLH